MSEIAGVLGVILSFEYAGKTYQIRKRNYEIISNMEAELEARALAKIRRHRHLGNMTDEEAKLAMGQFVQDSTSGLYAAGSEVWARWFGGTEEGIQSAFFHQLGAHNKTASVTRELVKRIYDEEKQPGAEESKWEELSRLVGLANRPTLPETGRDTQQASQNPSASQ